MALSAKLEFRQGQQLVMTPQLQQAIRLLQLSNLELNAFVEAELERNPLLEREEAEPEACEAKNDVGSTEDLDFASSDVNYTESFDTEFEDVYPEAPPSDFSDGPTLPNLSNGPVSSKGSGGSFDDTGSDIEAFVADKPNLKDFLTEQLNLTVPDATARMIGLHLIDLVDDAGYLRADLGELAEKLGTTIERIEDVLVELHTLEPTGVFARNLSECLALQLKEQNRYDPVIAALLDNLELLASHNLAALRKAVGVDQEELAEMIVELKSLDPKPGLKFGSSPVQPVVPDVMVRAANDGGWIVELNNDTLPRVLVDRSYYARVSKSCSKGEEKEYIQDCLQTANWLVKSLDQRARTILRVSEEIVRQQDGFFMHGVEHLRPLNLRTVADAISMHESTISRVTSNKYMATSRGILELKYFFTSAISASDDGDSFSSEAVRHRIKAMIDAETAQTVLSDDKIVERLKVEGIDIARERIAHGDETGAMQDESQRRYGHIIAIGMGQDICRHERGIVFIVEAAGQFDFLHFLTRRHIQAERALHGDFLVTRRRAQVDPDGLFHVAEVVACMAQAALIGGICANHQNTS
ncbi:MAG: RNA polymerase factor sigma-54 [Alphaproteobacteria bacterium]|nr:RNA polymerase factor sigma-54 [Alphaproteobacteria bacterium]